MHRPTTTTLDRKSTRLNSSHLVISYAVFCLKKKNEERAILLASHEPLISSLMACLVDSPALSVDMKKAALVRLDCEPSFFFNDTAPTGIFTPFPTRRSSD